MKDAYVLKLDYRITILFSILTILFWLLPILAITTDGNLFAIVIFTILGLLGTIPIIVWLSERKKKLIIDTKGITSPKINVEWSEVAECVRMHDGRHYFLYIKTYSGEEQEEPISRYKYDVYELAHAIDSYAGRSVFNLERSLLIRRHENVSMVCMVISMLLFMISLHIFALYCTSESVPEAQNILAWCVIGALMCVATVGHYRYMQAWNRRNNYKD
ncbi:MAG: hypothetical protein IKR17_03010 [Bacteroidales bacterium]|nr:hypothetical protein [Bacteroidales bacterium]